MQFFTSPVQLTSHLQELYSRKNVSDLSRYGDAIKNFCRLFGYSSAGICSSSGRVEFIGNHTDHNGGKVIACAINLDIIAAFRPTNNNVIRIAGKNRGTLRVDVNELAPTTHNLGLVKGVVRYLKENGYKTGGFDAYTDSAVPTGAGVSSSAAFELAVGTILSVLYNDGGISPDVLARAGQFAENVYFRKPCGLLDQSVVAVGGALVLDFADGMSYRRLNARFDGLDLALINAGGSHSQLSPLYAAIPADMKEVAALFGKTRLIDVDPQAFFDGFGDVSRRLGNDKALRAKHFFEEQARVEEAESLLQAPCLDVERIISLVNDSGDSSLTQLRNCAVDDNDTAIADIISFVRGICPCAARVHGGGFAGTVLCVVPSRHFADFLAQTTQKYGAKKVIPLNLRAAGAKVF